MNLKKNAFYPVFYMFIVTAVFSSVVIGFTIYTRDRVEANQALAFQSAVVKALGLFEQGMTGVEVNRVFSEKVTEPQEDAGGAYTHRSGGSMEGYAVTFEGQGFWAPVKGVIGIKADKKTVRSIHFYEQAETPGLGAEITTEDWRGQFEGLEVSYEGKAISMERPGAELEQGQVHAVTGATQTSVRVERIINDALDEWFVQVGVKEGGE